MAFEIDIGLTSSAGSKDFNEDFCAAMLRVHKGATGQDLARMLHYQHCISINVLELLVLIHGFQRNLYVVPSAFRVCDQDGGCG